MTQATERNVEPALRAYRGIAWVVGVLLIVLVCVGVPLKYAGDHPGVAKWVGIVHGMLFYPLFLLITFWLGVRARIPMFRVLVAMVLGTVPFLSFASERWTTSWVRLNREGAATPR
jgi:integral membrane protein